MRAAVLALCAALAAAPAMATQDAFPALYSVQDVASDDVLNVRAEPRAGAEIIGALPWNARDIEVVELAPRADWGRVHLDGRSGWVSLRFMRRHPGQFMGAFPEIARCAGTEPFWGLDQAAGIYDFSAPDGPRLGFTESWRGSSLGRRDRHALMLTGRTAEATAVISYGACSDGMSDRHYGLGIDLILEGGPDGPALYSGCCTLQP